MLKFTPLTAKGTNRDGQDVFEYLKCTEYYIGADGEQQDISQWMGQGAAALGLSGAVDIRTLTHLGSGFAPDGTTPLCQNAGDMGDEKNVGHRVGWDFTFSAPKDVSVLMADAEPGERENIIAVQREAVAEAMKYLEQFAQTRSGKQGLEMQGTKGIVAASFVHFGSRELDPQLHTHVLVCNTVQGDDGNWRTLETGQMYEHKRAAMALYHSGLAHSMQKLGYGCAPERELDADGRETGQVWNHIRGIPDSLCEERSKRRAQIVEYQKEHGGSMQAATMATRKHKDEPTFAELTATWKEELKQSRAADPTIYKHTDDIKGLKTQLLETSDAKVLEQLHENQAKFTKADLVERIAWENQARLSPQEVLADADKFLLRNNIIALDHRPKRGRMDQPQQEYAAQWMIDMEQQIGDRGVARKDDQSVRLSPTTVAAAVRDYERDSGHQLSREQKFAIDFVTTKSGGTACLSGWAGTGKTATAAVWIDAFEREGFQVLGCSTGWDAAEKLESETGIKSYSAASMLSQLENGKLALGKKSVVVFDEAGMAGTKTIHALQQHVDRVGAKLVIQGDHLQLQPIQAGAPFRLLVDKIGHAELKDVRRQRHEGDRETTRMLYRDSSYELGKQVMQRLDDQKQLSRHETRKQAIAQIADDYVASATPAREKLVVGGTRSDVRLLNLAIRERLQKSGVIGADQATFKAKADGQWSDLALAKGDRVRFTSKERLTRAEGGGELQVVNGLHGTVTGIEETATGSYRISVRTQSDAKSKDGVVVRFDTERYKSLAMDLAGTVHKSQGQSKEEVYHLASPEMGDQHLQLVAFSRTRRSYRMYGSAIDIDDMSRKVGMQRLKTNAIEQLPKAEKVVEKTPEITRTAPTLREKIEARKVRERGVGLGV